MNRHDDIQDELKQIGPFWTDVGNAIPYTLPKGYFDAFPGMVMEKIQHPFMLQSDTGNSYQAPEGYFESLPGSILSKIRSLAEQTNEVHAELETIAPFLNTISKKPVYSVPDGYFAGVDLIKTAQLKKQETKIFTLRSARRWMQYAAAAVVAGVLVTGAFLYTDNSTHYLEYEKYSQVDIPSGLNKVSEEELVKYLNSPEHIVLATTAGIAANEEELFEVKSSILDISDEELTLYLKENAEPAEKAASAKNE